MSGNSLSAYLRSGSFAGDANFAAVAETIELLAKAALEVRALVNQGALGSAIGSTRGETNADGDIQKELDVVADNIFLNAAKTSHIAVYGSEEMKSPVVLNNTSPFALAIDPLDGSSNIDTNVSIGTIFSLLPVVGDPKVDPMGSFLQAGRNQIAAGFFIYGPQLALVLTLGRGTQIFVHSSKYGGFIQAYKSISVAEKTSEFAVNASNYRHWFEPIRLYVDDCFAGTDGPRERDFNMRWIASLVADTYRILIRGGVFLYPGDQRRGYGSGRLRLVYEANPISFIVEQAGGAATDCIEPILDILPKDLHERVPLVFGSKKEVNKISRYHTDPSMIGERAPLFGKRGLFRA